MNTSSGQHDKLERVLTAALQEQPLRHAPQTLQSRVFAEIERRATRPWWRQSFWHWPMTARVALIIACIGLAKLGLQAMPWVIAAIDSVTLTIASGPPVTSLQTVTVAVTSIVRNLPPTLIQGCIAFIAAMYVALFGLSAVAYRTLYASQPPDFNQL